MNQYVFVLLRKVFLGHSCFSLIQNSNCETPGSGLFYNEVELGGSFARQAS
jgi:hypothetical protein